MSTACPLTPIGIFRSGKRLKFSVPSQASPDGDFDTIEIFDIYARGLRDLEGFEHLWVISWFHKNCEWRPMVLPPRGPARRRGVFATRSPHRPNPIGLTALKLLKIDGRFLTVSSSDLIDQTPIVDIKPYLSFADSFPTSRHGWIEEVEAASLTPPLYTISYEPIATDQLLWLRIEHGIDFMARAAQILERDPAPHRTRRIRPYGKNTFRMGCGPWRIIFSVNGHEVTISRIMAGYPSRIFTDPAYVSAADRSAQAEFVRCWPGSELTIPHHEK